MDAASFREQRKALGLTQEALADLLGVWPNTVARWEQGARPIPAYLELAMDAIICKRRVPKKAGKR